MNRPDKCAACVHWNRMSDTAKLADDRPVTLGECRRFPPARETLAVFPYSRNPVTDSEYWCGEFKKKGEA